MTLIQPVFSQTLRQIPDFRADRLGDHAIDDAGIAVVVVTTADPFSTNPRHEFQALKWTDAGAGSALTGFGGLGTTVSVSDDGQWIAFVSIADPLGQNNDRSLELSSSRLTDRYCVS